MNTMLVPHIKDIKYKGFHPNEKKKTIKKINLLIDKYNAFCYNFFGYNPKSDIKSNILNKYSSYNELIRILKKHGLEAYYQMCLSYIQENLSNIKDKVDDIENKFKKDFKKSIKSLTTSGQDLETINKNIEKNIFWKIYTVVGEDSLKVKNPEYKKLQTEMENTLKKVIKECNVNMIAVFKTYLSDKQEAKLLEASNHLNAVILGLENEIYKDITLKSEMEKVIQALKDTVKIMEAKKGTLSQDQIKLLNECLKGVRSLDDVKDINPETMKEKYFLSMIKPSNNETKKMIFIIISILTDSANQNELRKVITRNVKNTVKNSGVSKKN